MTKFIQFQFAHLILVDLMHWLCLLALLLLFLECFYHWLWNIFTIFKRFGSWVLLFLLFLCQRCFGNVVSSVCVNSLDLIRELLHFIKLLFLLLPLFAANVRSKSTHFHPLFLRFLCNWLSFGIHWRWISSFFRIFLALCLLFLIILQFFSPKLFLSVLLLL